MNAERELCAKLWSRGYGVLRAPASGSVDRPSPDVVALKGSGGFAIELKANADGTAHFDKQEILELNEWADRADLTPVVIVKPDLRTFDGWLVLHSTHLNETEQGYSLRKQDHEDCASLNLF